MDTTTELQQIRQELDELRHPYKKLAERLIPEDEATPEEEKALQATQDPPHRRTDPKPPRHQAEEAYKTYTVRLNSRAEKNPRTNQPQKHDTTPITRTTPRRKTHKPTDQPPQPPPSTTTKPPRKRPQNRKQAKIGRIMMTTTAYPPGGVHARGDTENIISVMSGSTP
jgi:hypothetical protein